MYKKHKIVMLPSTKFPEVGEINHVQVNSEDYKLELIHYVINGDGLKPQNLYILSSDDIVEGDWCIDYENSIFQYSENKHNAFVHTVCNKIIASTDKSLQLFDCHGLCLQDNNNCSCTLPSIPEYFIKYYIEQYNLDNQIEEIEVSLRDDNTIPLDDYGSIRIHIPTQWDSREQEYHKSQLKEETYSRSEVVELLKKFEESRNKRVWIPEISSWVLPLDKWIEQNLK